MLAKYDVTPEVLRQDLEALLSELLDHGLLDLKDG
ncbi:MAG: PqqD family peptide modification chaperone [Anaerolineales bacterium]|nr:PqqD family peptide modification chaperone [Anaerolineales bacterium]